MWNKKVSFVNWVKDPISQLEEFPHQNKLAFFKVLCVLLLFNLTLLVQSTYCYWNIILMRGCSLTTMLLFCCGWYVYIPLKLLGWISNSQGAASRVFEISLCWNEVVRILGLCDGISVLIKRPELASSCFWGYKTATCQPGKGTCQQWNTGTLGPKLPSLHTQKKEISVVIATQAMSWVLQQSELRHRKVAVWTKVLFSFVWLSWVISNSDSFLDWFIYSFTNSANS